VSTWALAASLALAAASAAVAAATTACQDKAPCVHRGQSGTYTGSAVYGGQISPTGIGGGPMRQVGGSIPTSITVDDFSVDDSCSGNPVEFTTRVAGCALWTYADDDSGTASIENGQTCNLPTSDGVATVTVQQGSLTTASQVTLTLAGPVTAFDEAGTDGYLQWAFTGQ
jgi:hypothetical protein